MQAICVDFIRQNSDKYICLSKCENGEEYFIRFKFTKNADETFSVVRIIYEMDEENMAYYNTKKESQELKLQKYLENEAV